MTVKTSKVLGVLVGQVVEMFLSWCVKLDRDSALFLRQTWRVFPVHSPAWQNVRPPCVDSLTTRGTSSWSRRADHRCRCPSMFETGRQSSAMYPGAMLCRHLNTWTHSLNRIRSATSSQCRTCRQKWVSPWSYLPLFDTTQSDFVEDTLQLVGAPASRLRQ